MALSFIKKVFTFGKPAEEPVRDAVERELEPRSRDEDLPVADDPVLPEEMDTAGGPAADIDDASVEPEPAEAETEVLPPADHLGDMGVVPLSLLEAEAEAEEGTPPALPGIPPTGGGTKRAEADRPTIDDEDHPGASQDSVDATQDIAASFPHPGGGSARPG
ncbi:signal recognition particle-docking protein FtsY [Rhizobium sp. Pop5]|nr:signal recognition particle-docking protein FtsY [Rhizobium sp. Pop5]